ncbi:transmembrane protein, putative (macronuclear) [Tetrahymena thermophila SB210]|uniref:Transmembrane protein, putative n=1 Tax=Tetrahymena thermophila (strain SB210) TaxID=312017 RepID=W7X684_TETTS|nr:transmembrane protein, putative [Tetrahymena thermophila SB210]EWS74875.1 transmembrane protein, putative [Tetrahymena thermophila SB210]|eukprot:XP_012652588.1 transmembrane protein, putative [Tetrahymena thermophila SB210]
MSKFQINVSAYQQKKLLLRIIFWTKRDFEKAYFFYFFFKILIKLRNEKFKLMITINIRILQSFRLIGVQINDDLQHRNIQFKVVLSMYSIFLLILLIHGSCYIVNVNTNKNKGVKNLNERQENLKSGVSFS